MPSTVKQEGVHGPPTKQNTTRVDLIQLEAMLDRLLKDRRVENAARFDDLSQSIARVVEIEPSGDAVKKFRPDEPCEAGAQP